MGATGTDTQISTVAAIEREIIYNASAFWGAAKSLGEGALDTYLYINDMSAFVFNTVSLGMLFEELAARYTQANQKALELILTTDYANLPGNVKDYYEAKWDQVIELRAQGKDAEAGEIAGEMALDLNLAIFTAGGLTKSLLTKVSEAAKVAQVAGGVGGIGKTGTVWDSIRATQSNHAGSILPRSFEMSLPNGQDVWIAPNATKHVAEYAQAKAILYTPEAVRMATQAELSSLQSALNGLTAQGIEYGKLYTYGGWELKFGAPRGLGKLPAVIHALPKELRK